MPARDDAIALLHELTKGESLRKHGLAVEASMRAYARLFGEDEETWGMVGILHDFDYEAHPTTDEHPFFGAQLLREKGWPIEIIDGILAHAPYSGVARDTPLKRSIFAVDELSGFVMACALVHGRSLEHLDPARVQKKLKDKSFARQVNRDDIRVGLEELGGEPAVHIQRVIDALKTVAPELGLSAD